jgi:hypothetical protein
MDTGNSNIIGWLFSVFETDNFTDLYVWGIIPVYAAVTYAFGFLTILIEDYLPPLLVKVLTNLRELMMKLLIGMLYLLVPLAVVLGSMHVFGCLPETWIPSHLRN